MVTELPLYDSYLEILITPETPIFVTSRIMNFHITAQIKHFVKSFITRVAFVLLAFFSNIHRVTHTICSE